jgi:hypothetical protein
VNNVAASPAGSPAFEALHRARIRGLVPVAAMGDVTPLVAEALLLVTARGVMLTPQGLARHDELILAWRSQVDLDPLAKAYERFLTCNQPVKDLCAGWQRGAGDDEALFMAVDALTGLLERARPALRRAGQAVPRFSSYTPRLEAAVAAAGAGDRRYITDPREDSVHTIWFECHEDFLVTLGRSREEEGSY